MTPLLKQLRELSTRLPMQVIVTLNLPEARPQIEAGPNFSIIWIENYHPKGFAENHNAAFECCSALYFCVMNPDVRVDESSLAPLIDSVQRRPGVAGPRVLAPNGWLEDSARLAPSPIRLLFRRLRRRREPDYSCTFPEQQVDWLAGMCLLFDYDTYRLLGGFDTKFRLYCEDTDICLRIHLLGCSVTWVQHAIVIHEARRASHRNWTYLRWHIGSLVRLMTSVTYWRFRFESSQLRCKSQNRASV
nr:glycosyltransferase family 2 protein [uncultured Cupriavidus sp.]